MSNLLPIDEINVLERYLSISDFSNLTADEVIDEVLDILLVAYANGVEYANEILGVSIKPSLEDLHKSVEKKFDGKGYQERVSEYFTQNDVESIIRVVETESHRIFNDATYETAKASGKKVFKTWATMQDDRVRDTHDFLEGVKVPLEERFYTSDGDSARFPGDFESAENNINCRCILSFSTD